MPKKVPPPCYQYHQHDLQENLRAENNTRLSKLTFISMQVTIWKLCIVTYVWQKRSATTQHNTTPGTVAAASLQFTNNYSHMPLNLSNGASTILCDYFLFPLIAYICPSLSVAVYCKLYSIPHMVEKNFLGLQAFGWRTFRGKHTL